MSAIEKNNQMVKELISSDEQKEIETMLSNVCLCLETSAKYDVRKKALSDEEVRLISSKKAAASDLNRLIYKLIYQRIRELIKQVGFDEEKTRKDILFQTFVKFLDKNPSEDKVAFFHDTLNIAILKLMGKRELLEQKGIEIKPLNETFNELLNSEWRWRYYIRGYYTEVQGVYENLSKQIIENIVLTLEAKENASGYVSNYIKALDVILERKNREEYKKTIYAIYKLIRKEKLTKHGKVSGAAVKRVPAVKAYRRALNIYDNQMLEISNIMPGLIYGNNKYYFDLSQTENINLLAFELLREDLNAPTFASNLGREALTLEEIRVIEENISNHEIKNYDEAAAILLNLRKKDNSDNNNK